MTALSHIIERDGDRFVVKVGRHVAGFITEDPERPGLWIVQAEDGEFMGRVGSRAEGGTFLAAWHVAGEADWDEQCRPISRRDAKSYRII